MSPGKAPMLPHVPSAWKDESGELLITELCTSGWNVGGSTGSSIAGALLRMCRCGWRTIFYTGRLLVEE